MKKTLILVGLVVLALAAVGFRKELSAALPSNLYVRTFFAQVTQMGTPIEHSVAKSYYRFASTDEASVCTGKCLIYDVILASGADGAYAILYDSAPATAGTTTIMGKVEFDGTGKPTPLAAGNPNAFPFMTTRGLGIDLSSVSGGEEVLVLYQDLD